MISRIFKEHPAAVGESYLEHMAFAFRFSGRLLRASAAAFIHGIVPALCRTTASTAVLEMTDGIRRRRAEIASGNAIAAAKSS